MNRAGDELEQEADRAADQVMRMPAPGTGDARPLLQGTHFPPLSHGRSAAKEVGEPPRKPAPAETVSPAWGGSPDVAHAVYEALRSPGRPLDSDARSFFEPRFGCDFGQVRLHDDAAAAASAQAVNARAYAVGTDLVFARGACEAATAPGRWLLAHELAHVVQQGNRSVGRDPLSGSALLQRTLTEAQLATTPDSTIRQDPDYLDNGIRRVEFYTAEAAIIHYEGGAQFRLGLVPGQIQPPVQGVDYRTRGAHVQVVPAPAGQTRFLPRARQIRAPGMTSQEVVREFSRTITYRLDAASHRIVPTEVNDLTAPRLCEILRRAEAEYVSRTDELARGMVRTLEVLQVVVILASLIPTAGRSASVAGTGRTAAAAGGAGVVARAVSTLRQLFLRLLRTGGTGSVTVEGVGFGGIRVVMGEGRVLTVLRNTIVNAERVPGQGRLLHAAFEQAAVAAGREAGAATVRVALETVINRQWAAYLESLGYAFEVVPNASGGATRVLAKVFSL